MKFSFGQASGNRAVQLSLALTLVFASTSLAEIAGATYDFSGNATGSTQISATSASLIAPAGSNFCVGPPTSCTGGGMFASFSFSNVSPTEDQITFNFTGSSDGFLTGNFTIDLNDFVSADGSTITGITHDSGNLSRGDFSNVSWNGTDAIFTGTPAAGVGQYNAVGGAKVVFDIAETAATPEPASLLLSGRGLAALAIAGVRRKGRG